MTMKIEYKIVAFSFILWLLVWVIDAAVDSLFFYEGSFWRLLISNSDGFELYLRSVWMALFLMFGLIMSRFMAKRKRAEEALRESEEKYKGIVEKTQDVIMLTKLDGSCGQ